MKRGFSQPGFLGRGWNFPPAFDRFSGGAVMSGADEHIKRSIRLILSVRPGERQMLPGFGCDLDRYAFAAPTLTLATKIEREIAHALLEFEPRIDVEGVNVTPQDDAGRWFLLIALNYRIRATNRRDNMVFPYYCNERAGIPG